MKYLPFDIKDISNYRAELMGWSILWIMMLHFTFTQIKPMGFIAQYGYAGVDIFILVSGLGLFFSLEKSDNILHFYKKRLLRIFPTYYLIGFFKNLLLDHRSYTEYIYQYTTLGYWTGGDYNDWYIPALIMLYLISPVIKILLDKHFYFILCGIVMCSFFTAYYFIDKEELLDRSHFFLIYRIPDFIFGMICAYWIKQSIPTTYYYIILIAGFPLFAILYPSHHLVYNYKYFSLVFLLPFFIFIFIQLSKYIKFINPILAIIGKASFEIYLIQGIFFSAILKELLPIIPLWHDVITIILVIGSSLLGILTHWLIGKIGFLRLS